MDIAPPTCATIIHLQAISLDRNVARDYLIHVAPDLFGHFVLEKRWGRIGTKGTAQILSFAKQSEVAAHLNLILRRRASARKRIGVPYRIIATS
jgi:predicted DNA-binding WGR domain protein